MRIIYECAGAQSNRKFAASPVSLRLRQSRVRFAMIRLEPVVRLVTLQNKATRPARWQTPRPQRHPETYVVLLKLWRKARRSV